MRRLAHVGHRATAARLRAHGPARHRTFAAQLRARRRVFARQAPLALVLLRPLRPLVLRRGLSIGLALNLLRHGTLVRSALMTRAAADARRDAPVLRAQPHAQVQRTAAGVPPHATRVESHRTALIERVLAGHSTTVRHMATHCTHGTRIERTTAYPRTAIALARLQPPAATAAGGDALPAAPGVDGMSRAASIGPALFAGAADAMLPPRELARVTDHVLTQLDRKVLSFRERHGQI